MEVFYMNITKAVAHIKGSREYPTLHGMVTFKQTSKGVLVTSEIYGLPDNNEYNVGVFAFHIHNGMSCTGTREEPFVDAGTHYNPEDALHPYHAGDLPPLFSNNGYAYMSVFTNQFNLREIPQKGTFQKREIFKSREFFLLKNFLDF